MLDMLKEHWFWLITVIAVIVWYSTITIYVGVRGAFDIKSMFEKLKNLSKDSEN